MAKYKMVADGMPVFEGDEYWDGKRWRPVVPYYGRPAPRGTLVRRPTMRATDAEDSAASQAVSNADNLSNSDGSAVRSIGN